MKDFFDWAFGLGLIGNAALFVPQAIALWRKKSAEGASLITFAGFNVLQLVSVVHGLYWHDKAMIIGMGASFITCGAVTMLTVIYRMQRPQVAV